MPDAEALLAFLVFAAFGYALNTIRASVPTALQSRPGVLNWPKLTWKPSFVHHDCCVPVRRVRWLSDCHVHVDGGADLGVAAADRRRTTAKPAQSSSEVGWDALLNLRSSRRLPGTSPTSRTVLICDPAMVGAIRSPALARALDELGLHPHQHRTPAPAPGQSPAAAARQPSRSRRNRIRASASEFLAAEPLADDEIKN